MNTAKNALKIGFVQFSPILGDPVATRNTLGRLIKDVADADLLVLPELCNSGYCFRSPEEARDLSEEIGVGPFSNFLQVLCQKYGMHIVSGINERSEGRLYNSSLLVGPEGTVGTYRKLHLFKNEKDFFTPGDLGLPVFHMGSVKPRAALPSVPLQSS